MSMVNLNCLASGHDPDTVFTVQVATNEPLTILELFKLKVPLALNNPGLAPATFQADNIEPILDKLAEISSIFGNPVPGKVHVIVGTPPGEHQGDTHGYFMAHVRSVTRKRLRPASFSLKNELMNTALVQEAPSRIAKPSAYWDLQAQPTARLLDDRPAPDPYITPIGLLYHGFGRFDDIITGRMSFDTVVRCNNIKTPEFDTAVNKFVRDMTKRFKSEDGRRDLVLEGLNQILGANHGPGYYELSPSAIGLYRADGRSVGPDGKPLTVVECRNDIAGTIADPCVEAVAYVAQLSAKLVETPGWRLSCLVITVVGAYIRTSGFDLNSIVERPRLHRYVLCHRAA
jgi:hypothetical protein